MILITFSWDDGSVEDMRMVDLSVKLSIPGMFFIPASNPERGVLGKSEIREIYASGFEIGAHTYSHRYLSELSISEGEQEIIKGKDFLEGIVGNKIDHFCFPGGRYNKSLVKISENHFKSARTADTGALIDKNTFLLKPAFHFYNRGKSSLLYNSFKNRSAIFPAVLKNLSEDSYFNMLKRIITKLDESKGIHRMIIWGHSWEIEQHSLWNELELFFVWLNKSYPLNLRSYSGILLNGYDSGI